MPEVKRDFRMGKMNKDLDERIVPNGEYRDALNIQVAGSEGSDVGTAQNILGTTSLSSTGIAGAKCIGVVPDTENNKIYWLICGNSVDAIAEYSPDTNIVVPVIVDTNNVLNFSKENKYRVTGINIIEGLLFWTDNNSEPKKIDIAKFKAGSVDFATHTYLVDQDDVIYNFTIDDVTVIKKAPIEAPTLTMSDSLRGGVTATTLDQVSFFDDSEGEPMQTGPYEHGFIQTSIEFGQNMQVGDRLALSLFDDDNEEVLVILGVTGFPHANLPQNISVSILSISPELDVGTTDWRVKLIEDKKLFEFKFPRFAYRYKYYDGQYSSFGPFTQVAFIPDEFDYSPKKGYNLGMVNKLKKLTISNFRTSQMPKDVEEIDILYKEDKSTNVYNIKSIKGDHNNRDQEWTDNSIEIESEVIYKNIPSMQMLRPFDNVPKKAKAQEFVANRVVYGNYTQQYNLIDSDGSEITPKFEVSITNSGASYEEGSRIPGASMKSMRTYQIGVVYQDMFGRQTPVLTDPSGSIQLPKAQATGYNVVNVKMLNLKPTWATHYKYYIKETSAEYYNLSMDRHYPAEDGNVWIAFPSSERNKVDDETFLIIKKEHDSDNFVEAEARYKVIAIENNAPDFLTRKKISKGHATANSDGNLFVTNGYPEKNTSKIVIPRDQWKKEFGGPSGSSEDVFTVESSIHTETDLFVRIKNGNRVTKYYEIANITYEPDPSNDKYAGTTTTIDPKKVWQINIVETFDESDVDWLGSVGAGTNVQSQNMRIEIAKEVHRIKPQFTGRFFVKINRDTTLETHITNFANLDELRVVAELPFWQVAGGAGGSNNMQSLGYNTNAGSNSSTLYRYWRDKNKGHSGTNTAKWFIARHGRTRWHKDLGGDGIDIHRGFGNADVAENTQMRGIRQGETIIEIAYHGFGKDGKDTRWGAWTSYAANPGPYKDFVRGIEQIGNIIRFTGDPDENQYTIKGWRLTGQIAYKGISRNGNGYSGKFSTSRILMWTLKLNKPIEWAPEDNISGITDDAGNNTPIQVGTNYVDEGDLDGFTTTNPAIWETEPKEMPELDIYYEASNAYHCNTHHGSMQTLPYHNCYSFTNGVESNRIRDDFNASQISKGVKASSTLEDQYKEENRKTGLIYSQIFNSRAGVNRLNQFIMADKITKDLNPEYGSIQLLHTRETDLLSFCEDKVVKILANKDALFNADGNANLTASTNVLGQAIIPATFGEYGIGKNPESFASYAYRSYFTDKPKGAVLRLSMDGITAISEYGMRDYFADKLAQTDRAIGMYDDSKDLYNLTMMSDTVRGGDDTVSFMERVQGWPSRKSFLPEAGVSLNNIFYSFRNGELYSHTNTTRNNFYGVQYESKVKIIFNDAPDVIKSFNTINYEGTQQKIIKNESDNQYYNLNTKKGWYANSVVTDLQEGKVYQFKGKDRKFFGYVQGLPTTISNLDTREFSVQGIGVQKARSGDTTPQNVTITIVENND